MKGDHLVSEKQEPKCPLICDFDRRVNECFELFNIFVMVSFLLQRLQTDSRHKMLPIAGLRVLGLLLLNHWERNQHFPTKDSLFMQIL